MVRPLRVRPWQKLMLVSIGCSFLAATLFGVLLLLIRRGSVDMHSAEGAGIMLFGAVILGLGWFTGSLGMRAHSEREHERAHRSPR